MRVVQIIDTLHWGGVQALQVTLAAAARYSKLQLSVVALRDDPSTPYRAELTDLGVPVEIFPSKKMIDPGRIWRLSRYLQAQRIDLVHTHLPTANIVGTCAARLAGLPAVGSLHLSLIEPHRPRRILETAALRLGANRIMAVGETTKATHQHRFPQHEIMILPNAVPLHPPLSTPARRAIRRTLIGDSVRENHRPILLSVGRLAPEKGFDDLLAAMRILRRQHDSFWLGIVGEGAQRAALEQLITTFQLEKQVTLLGARPDVPDLLRAADLYVCASHSEAMPISVLEAMAAGLPVVATDVGEIHTVLNPNRGRLVIPGSAHALTHAIGQLLDLPQAGRSLGEQGRQLIASQYGPTAWLDQLYQLYASVLASAK